MLVVLFIAAAAVAVAGGAARPAAAARVLYVKQGGGAPGDADCSMAARCSLEQAAQAADNNADDPDTLMFTEAGAYDTGSPTCSGALGKSLRLRADEAATGGALPVISCNLVTPALRLDVAGVVFGGALSILGADANVTLTGSAWAGALQISAAARRVALLQSPHAASSVQVLGPVSWLERDDGTPAPPPPPPTVAPPAPRELVVSGCHFRGGAGAAPGVTLQVADSRRANASVSVTLRNTTLANCAPGCVDLRGANVNATFDNAILSQFARYGASVHAGAQLLVGGGAHTLFVGRSSNLTDPAQAAAVIVGGNGTLFDMRSYTTLTNVHDGIMVDEAGAAIRGATGVTVAGVYRGFTLEQHARLTLRNVHVSTTQRSLASWCVKCDRGCAIDLRDSFVGQSERGVYVAGGLLSEPPSLVVLGNNTFSALGNERLFCGAAVFCSHARVIVQPNKFADILARQDAETCCRRTCDMTFTGDSEMPGQSCLKTPAPAPLVSSKP